MSLGGLDHIHTSHTLFEHRGGVYGNTTIRAGIPTVERMVAPSGREWERSEYPVEVQVTASPTGRSVQVFVNGKKVLP